MDTASKPEQVNRKQVGTITMVAGGLFVLGALLAEAVEWLWILVLVGLLALIYVVPKVHAYQTPADGPVGEWGSRLVLFGAGLVVLLGIVFLTWEAVGDPPEENALIDALWMIGFFAFLIGIVLFAIGTVKARVFPVGGPALMLLGLVGGVALDMATGAFFEEEPETTAWGFVIGVSLFGLGVAWIGYSLWREETPAAPPPADAA